MKVHTVEQRSPEWYRLRLGIPTASEFSNLITPTGRPSKSLTAYAYSLAAEVYVGRPLDVWNGNAWTERGKEMERQAVELYEFVTGKTVEPIGFVTNDDGSAGCSPDGFLDHDGMLEVKALKYDHHIAAAMQRAKGETPADHMPQTQGQIMLCERAWCDLFFYHPELPSFAIRQYPDEAVQAVLKPQLAEVIAERDRVLAALKSLSAA